ncbi:MAG: cytochrome c oxidase assembly protein [Actinomycetota bacterium]|nr:cytochrome c oxidase assembly protein [Actinomycetota bacterium]
MPRSPAGTSWRTIALISSALALVALVQLMPDSRFVTEAGEHLVLGMLAPLLIVAAQPGQLVGAAVGPRRLHRWSRTPYARVATAPMLVAVGFAVTPWLLWLTPLRAVLSNTGPVHLLVHVHLFVVGLLFVEHLAGRAPLPTRLTPPMRLLIGAVVLVSHGFLGLVLTSLDRPVLSTDLPVAAGIADQRAGAQVMWVGGEFVMVGLLAATMWEWMRREERSTPRHTTGARADGE